MPKRCRSESEALAKLVVHYFENSCESSISNTCKYFGETGVPTTTVRDILRRYENEGRIMHKSSTGRNPSVSTPKLLRKVAKLFEREPNISIRRAAARLGVKRSTLCYMKVRKLGIVGRKKVTAPMYTGDQAERAKAGCRKIYRKLLFSENQKVLLIDDETYVPADPTQIPGCAYYHCRSNEVVPDAARFKGKQKFPKKYLVWQCLDEDGNLSEPFISTGTIDADTYKRECLTHRLLPFINLHHRKADVLFWPDMATSHYAGAVTQWLDENGIDYVKRADNAPNVPQARPIERFWALCKAEYAHRKEPAKSLRSFSKIWRNVSRKVAQRSGIELMRSTRRTLRAIAYGGVYAPLRKN